MNQIDIDEIIEDLDSMVELSRIHSNMVNYLNIVHSAVAIRKLLDKEIPLKPKSSFNLKNEEIYYCPHCGERVDEEYDDFCFYCRGKLLW